MFSHSLLFLLIIFVGHCYAKFPFPPLGVPHAKPPFCHKYTGQQNCLDQKISTDPEESWCIYSNPPGPGCIWNIGNINNFYCRFQTPCPSPFCRSIDLPGIDECEATSIVCLSQNTSQRCAQHGGIMCRWFTPGETPADNPNFGVCGSRFNLKLWPFG